MAVGLLGSACAADSTPEPIFPEAIDQPVDLDCIGDEPDELEYLNSLPGINLGTKEAVDKESEAVFNGATVDLANEVGYGSGGYFEDLEGNRSVHTVGHVAAIGLFNNDDTLDINIFIDGADVWYNPARCGITLEDLTLESYSQVNYLDADTGEFVDTDFIVGIPVPDEANPYIDAATEAGELKSLGSFATDVETQNIEDELQSQNNILVVPNQETGLFEVITPDSNTAHSGSELFAGFSVGVDGEICQGDSGSPVLLAELKSGITVEASIEAGSITIEDVQRVRIASVGALVLALQPSTREEGQRRGFDCSNDSGTITYTVEIPEAAPPLVYIETE